MPRQCTCLEQDIRGLHSDFVADAVAGCKEAADAVEGAHQALAASGVAQAQLLESTVAAQHAAAQQALAAAQVNVAATIRCELPHRLPAVRILAVASTCRAGSRPRFPN